jgi:hypothetical protein
MKSARYLPQIIDTPNKTAQKTPYHEDEQFPFRELLHPTANREVISSQILSEVFARRYPRRCTINTHWAYTTPNDPRQKGGCLFLFKDHSSRLGLAGFASKRAKVSRGAARW